MMGGLRHVGGVEQVVIRIAVLAVSLFETQQERLQRLRTDLQFAREDRIEVWLLTLSSSAANTECSLQQQ